MKYSKLGRTGLDVSRVCLGTMTWGEQNTEEQAHEQMDYAVERGINFFDTAELYAVPISERTYGKTEEMIGTWFEKTGKREDIILASKVAGHRPPWIRGGVHMTGESVRVAVEGSLRRLKTDYIDLYQLHWPNRPYPHHGNNMPGALDFTAVKTSEIEDNLMDILEAVDEVVKAGKVRHLGLSNDTAWGIMKWLDLAKEKNMPRVESVQNEFSPLDRTDDPYVAEVCVREEVAYLPYSPLAMGILTGKYRTEPWDDRSRFSVAKRINSDPGSYRFTDASIAAVDEYAGVAEKHGLDLTQMVLKWVDLQTFVTSTIIGATTMEQLKTDIDAFDLDISGALKDIEAVYRKYPIPY